MQNVSTLRTIENIKKTLAHSLNKDYNVQDDEILNELLKIHGLHVDNFDFLNNIDTLMNERLNDVSTDDNSNKNEKTISGIIQESINPVKKAIGYDYLYQKLKTLYGRVL